MTDQNEITPNTEELPCHKEAGLQNPVSVKCPCGCKGGILKSDGRNVQDNLTFLMCSVCKCTYVADDNIPET